MGVVANGEASKTHVRSQRQSALPMFTERSQMAERAKRLQESRDDVDCRRFP